MTTQSRFVESPTKGETFFYHNETTPLLDIGRDRDQEGVHVLVRPDGSVVRIGGYHLRRAGEVWSDPLATD